MMAAGAADPGFAAVSGCTASTANSPRVRVPVLSNTTVVEYHCPDICQGVHEAAALDEDASAGGAAQTAEECEGDADD